MLPTHAPYCDCCGLPIHPRAGEACPRCGYPVNLFEEESFLGISLRNLQRVATYGGASLTVTQLIHRYQARLEVLRQLNVLPVPPSQNRQPSAPISPPSSGPIVVVPPAPSEKEKQPVQPMVPSIAQLRPSIAQSLSALPLASSEMAKTPEKAAGSPSTSVPAPMVGPVRPILPPIVAAPVPPKAQSAARVFSVRSFFADQTINIVASLGAFLILVGSLGFIATTQDLLLSFLIMFGVHAVFGVTGVVSYRFRSFRLVSVIYTAIFALLVPLVGFSGYRLVAGHLIQLSSPTLVAIAATYAAIVYAALAIHQSFKTFAYLGVVALAVADLAVAYAAHLGYWWWPAALMVLALPSLMALPRASGRTPFLIGSLAVLREPLRLLMYSCVTVCITGIVFAFVYSLDLDILGHSLRETRFSIVCMMLLLLCWLCLFIWQSGRRPWANVVPYLFVALVLLSCYAFALKQVGYVLAVTIVALLFHGLTLFVAPLLRPWGRMELHLERLTLLLVGLVPFIAAPLLPLQILGMAYHYPLVTYLPEDLVMNSLATLIGCVLTVSIVLRHTGLNRIPDDAQKRWCWLLLFSGFLLNSAYGMAVLLFNTSPVWWFLGLTLFFVAGSVVARRLLSASWANPLDLLALCGSVQTLLLSFSQRGSSIILLLLFFAVLSYCVALYQRRRNWFFLPPIYALLIWFPPTSTLFFQQVLLIGSLLLPLVASAVHRLVTVRWRTAQPGGTPRSVKDLLGWEWPLLVVGLIYGAMVCLYNSAASMSVVQNWWHLDFPVALEMTTLALVWYISAALARMKWWQLFAVGFAIPALLIPADAFGVLAWVAPLLVVVAFAINRLAGRIWALPLYGMALLAACMMGIHGYDQGQMAAATWALFIFALAIYLAGLAMNDQIWMWAAPVFATWSVCYSIMLGDIYRPFIVVLLCAAIGVGIGCLRFVLPPLDTGERREKLLRFAMPFYVMALASGLLMGVYDTLIGIRYPFYAAVPDALFVFALVAYGVLLFERRPSWLALPATFAIWGVLLAGLTTAYYVAGIALIAVMLGIVLSRVIKLPPPEALLPPVAYTPIKFSWGWPWYATALVAVVLLGSWQPLALAPPVAGFIEYSLLAFALLAYVVGVIEDALAWSWIGALLAIWSLVDSVDHGDLSRLFVVALICVGAGLLTFAPGRWPVMGLLLQRRKRVEYALPFYAVAIASAVFTGVYGSVEGANYPFPTAIPDVLFVYALIAYSIVHLERRPFLLALPAALGAWGMLLAGQTSAYYVAGMGLVMALLGLVLSGVIAQPLFGTQPVTNGYGFLKMSWGWPWYVASLLAALLLGNWGLMHGDQPVSGFIEYALLMFAVLAYIVGVVEDMLLWSWVGSALAVWSLADAALRGDVYRLFTVTLLCAGIGMLTFVLKRFVPAFAVLTRRRQRIEYALPFYGVAIASAFLIGVPAEFLLRANYPFYAAIPESLFVYALLAYGVLLLERRANWQWLVAVFAIWGTSLIWQTIGCRPITSLYSPICGDGQSITYWLTGIAYATAVLGLVAGRLSWYITGEASSPLAALRAPFRWNWSWYLTTIVAILLTVVWNVWMPDFSHGIMFGSLFALIVLTIAVMLIERSPEMLVVPVALAAWSISQTQWLFWQQILAYTILCVLIFASQFIWRALPAATHLLPSTRLHRILALGGSGLVILMIIIQGGLFAASGMLAHMGAVALLVLAGLLFWYGCLQMEKRRRHWCFYGSGLLLSLVAPWELSALGLTHLDWLTLVPASYLVVVAPFLSRDEVLPYSHRIGQICSILGSALLLLPTLWLSFNQDNLQPTLVLAGESLVLLLLGITTRIRFFVLSGAALVVVSAMHALFLPSLSIPPSLALAILGGVLLAIATGLSLARHRLQTAWAQWE
ncbi:MAG TPA: hypothetical protein VKR06_04060 [Ktedonosporobacter sp.]|nr:hypothetical protein [Ktedonosporobacter sp.]